MDDYPDTGGWPAGCDVTVETLTGQHVRGIVLGSSDTYLYLRATHSGLTGVVRVALAYADVIEN